MKGVSEAWKRHGGGALYLVLLLVYYITMKKVNMYDAKTHLSEYLAGLGEGEALLICKRNKPVAELRPLPKKRKGSRPIGLGKSVFRVSARFFEPLPDGVVRAFRGEDV